MSTTMERSLLSKRFVVVVVVVVVCWSLVNTCKLIQCLRLIDLFT